MRFNRKVRTEIMAATFGVILRHMDVKIKQIMMAGVGQATEVRIFRMFWPRSRIIGIDPAPEHEEWMSPPYEYVQAAIARGEENTIELYCGHRAADQTSKHHGKWQRRQTIVVPRVSFDALWEQYGRKWTMLWVDCNGSELEVFLSGQKALASGRIHVIAAELYPGPNMNYPHPQLSDNAIREHGFHQIWTTGNLKWRMREGKGVNRLYLHESVWK